ncbi:MAG: CHAT domain-containing protein [Polyangiaceae bacterium]|nr:CHAT domain-containing protein [Polyangiaceae bacterium]
MSNRFRNRLLALTAGVFLSALAPLPSSADDAPAASKPGASAQTSRLAEADKLAAEVERLADEARYAKSLELALAVLGIREKELGPDHPKTGAALSDVAALHIQLGDDLAAEPLIQRAVKIFDGPQSAAGDPLDRSSALSNLSSLFLAKKQPAKAKAYATLAFESYKSSPKPDPSELASFESQLAFVLSAAGDIKGADTHYRAAIAVHEKVGPERALAIDCIRYGNMLRATAKPRSGMYLERGYQLALKSVGPSHPLTAQAIRAFGRTMWGGGSSFNQKGLEVYQTAHAALSGALGDAHPSVADLEQDWAVMRQIAGDLKGSLELRRKADIVEERELERRIAAGTERDALDYAQNLYRRVDRAVGLALSLGHRDADAAIYATEMVLRRKGQVLDVLRGGRTSLRKKASVEEKKLLGQLASVRAQIAETTLAGPQGDPAAFKAKLKNLGEEEQSIEAQVSAISRIYREARVPVSLAAVQAALPEGSILVEIFRWKPVEIHALADLSKAESYVVLLIDKHNQPRPFILSDAATVDKLVNDFRKALTKRDDPFVYDVGYRLGMVLLGRIEGALQKYKHVFIAPDSEVNLVPFGALVDTKGQLYLGKYDFTYLSSGRDLLRFAEGRGPSSGKAVVFANPRYGERGGERGGAGLPPGSRGLPPADFLRMRFPPLPGTQAEAEAIAKIISKAELFTDDQATESAIKAVQSPSVLHIATHGFFLSPIPIVTSKTTRGLELETTASTAGGGAKPARPPRTQVGLVDNPMLRSGLAFAGANALASGDEDGILTALEASTLDLDGTDLVVLSACETGVGQVERGQGVFSLRRALVEAGAATQVMSLWEVDDEATKQLMSSYYEKLFKQGKGRTQALREVQYTMASQKSTKHPFYWAAFIVSGDPSPLNLPEMPKLAGGNRGGSKAPGKVEPSARGCGCSMPGQEEDNSNGFYLFIGALAASRIISGRSPCSRARKNG